MKNEKDLKDLMDFLMTFAECLENDIENARKTGDHELKIICTGQIKMIMIIEEYLKGMYD